jgi:hypothetical protein
MKRNSKSSNTSRALWILSELADGDGGPVSASSQPHRHAEARARRAIFQAGVTCLPLPAARGEVGLPRGPARPGPMTSSAIRVRGVSASLSLAATPPHPNLLPASGEKERASAVGCARGAGCRARAAPIRSLFRPPRSRTFELKRRQRLLVLGTGMYQGVLHVVR